MEDVDEVRWTNKLYMTTVLIEPCFSGCTNDQDCQGNQICDANGRCRAGEMHKLLVTTVFVKSCFLASKAALQVE